MRLTIGLWLAFAGLALAGPEDSACKVTHLTGAASRPVLDSGSGTVVKSAAGVSYVLTNWHVAPDRGDGIRVFLGGKSHAAEWVAADSGKDLALLRVNADLPAVEIAEGEPAVGTTLRQWGHPFGGPRKAKSGPAIGTNNSWRSVPGGGEVYYTGIVPESGDSGCGVFDPDGHLVAVCWGGGPPRQSCVRLADVKKFVAENAK